jgi:hypothetical protein
MKTVADSAPETQRVNFTELRKNSTHQSATFRTIRYCTQLRLALFCNQRTDKFTVKS